MEMERYTVVLTDAKGKLFEVPLRRGNADSAFIDQISFSLHLDTFPDSFLLNEEYIVHFSSHLEQIFGFGISQKAKGTGGRFYKECWLMGTETVQYGRVHIGGQLNTILVELTATGCNASADGWESRLFNYLQKCVRPKITRVDIAKDFFDGEYSPDQAKADRLKGLFTAHRVMPNGESVGSDWESGTLKGKTYYIGSRESSKFARIYEKGKQLGDKTSNWTRFEIEFKSRDIIIPLDVLINAGEYFGGAYPICEQFSEKASRIHAVKKNLDISFDRVIEVAKQQCGRAINAAISMFPNKSASEILNMFKPSHDLLPSRLQLDRFDCSHSDSTPIHKIFDFEVSAVLNNHLQSKINQQNEAFAFFEEKALIDDWRRFSMG